MFPKPTFNTETKFQNFVPSPTAEGGNRKARRAAFKKLPRSIRKGADLGMGFRETEANANHLKDMMAEIEAESFPDSPTAETVYANHKHPKGRVNNGSL